MTPGFNKTGFNKTGFNKSCHLRGQSCNAGAMVSPATRPPRTRPRFAGGLILAEALAALILASLAIALLPFHRVAAFASTPGRGATRTDAEAVRRARSALIGWSRRVPWRAVCFQKGLALHWMLRRRGIRSVLLYGVRQDGDELAAHVWIDVDGETVIGGEEAPTFTCLARFPPEAG